jgi:hypothetical protein
MQRMKLNLKQTAIEQLEPRFLRIVTPITPSLYEVDPGEGFDGVAYIESLRTNNSLVKQCTATILSPNSQFAITAAHCLYTNWFTFDAAKVDLKLELLSGDVTIQSSSFFVNPGFNGYTDHGADIALLRLDQPAPGGIGFELFRNSNEIGQQSTRVGYGIGGLGSTGMQPSAFPVGTKRSGFNEYESDGLLLSTVPGCGFPYFVPAASTTIGYDFDSGLSANDYMGHYFGNNYADVGYGNSEVMASAGDSGGPVFVSGTIAGITSFGGRCEFPPDVTTSFSRDASFGEFGVDTRVSAFASWIDDITTPPKVAGVTIGSTGAQPDYVVPADGTGAQRKTLPLFNAGAVNEIKVRFSEGVTVQQSHLSVRPVGGSNLAIQSFTAPSAQNNFTGTWVTTAGLGAGIFEIELSNNIVDSHGNRLDGEWTNPTSATQTSGASAWPSGDGTNGTYFGGSTSTFEFQFVIQPGDVDRDNDVDLDDLNTVRSHIDLTSPTNLLAAWAFGNMDWSATDTTVDLDDLNAVRNNFGASWGGGQLRTSGGGPTIGEEALRAALYELYLTTFENPSEDDLYSDLLHWDLLGDDEWWKVTLGG